VKVIRHQNIFMEQVSPTSVEVPGCEKQFGPLLIPKQRPSFPSLGGDKVCVAGGRLLPRRSQILLPSGAKAPLAVDLYGAPKGAPLQNQEGKCQHFVPGFAPADNSNAMMCCTRYLAKVSCNPLSSPLLLIAPSTPPSCSQNP
jgi:hypothetical protein